MPKYSTEPFVRKAETAELPEIVDMSEGPSFGRYVDAKMEIGFDNSFARMAGDFFRMNSADLNEGENSRVMSPDEILRSPFYREGTEYGDKTTLGEMKYRSAQYDKRRRRDAIVEQRESGVPFVEPVLGFGAAMLGTAVSPESWAGGFAVKAGYSMGTNIARSALSNMVLTGAIDIAVLENLRAQGEHISAMDYVMDIGMAGLIGVGLTIPGVRRLHAKDGTDKLAKKLAKELGDTPEAKAKALDILSRRKKVNSRILEVGEAQMDASGEVSDINLGKAKDLADDADRINEIVGGKNSEKAAQDHADKYGKDSLDHDMDDAEIDLHSEIPKEPTHEEIGARLEKMIDEDDGVEFGPEFKREKVRTLEEIENDPTLSEFDKDIEVAGMARNDVLKTVKEAMENGVKAAEEAGVAAKTFAKEC